MTPYALLILVALASFWLGRQTASRKAAKTAESGTFTPPKKEKMKELRAEARQALSDRTAKRKQKILEFMKKEAIHHRELQACGIDTSSNEFNRRDVQKLLDVSEGTARKYLNALESAGKIKQIGKTGPDVYYILKGQQLRQNR